MNLRGSRRRPAIQVMTLRARENFVLARDMFAVAASAAGVPSAIVLTANIAHTRIAGREELSSFIRILRERRIAGMRRAARPERSAGCFSETNAPDQTGADLEDHPNHPPGRDHVLEAGSHGLVEYKGID
jgi:hypothetical protein